jgi:MADS-box transcription factor
MGQDLYGLSIKDLQNFENTLEMSLKAIRMRKVWTLLTPSQISIELYSKSHLCTTYALTLTLLFFFLLQEQIFIEYIKELNLKV